MEKKYIIRLSDEERAECMEVIKKLKGSSTKVRRAQILLKADVNGESGGWTDAKIAEAFNCRTRTVEKLRQRVVENGFEEALNGKKRKDPPVQAKLDGKGEAKLIAMRLGEPPEGYGKWTLQLLADELVSLNIVESICPETVRKTLKKKKITKRAIEYWVIPPEQNAEFVAGMEEILEIYEQPYDPEQPVVCMDEQPYQLVSETRTPIPATTEHPQRVDYEYERNGTASIFMFVEPLAGFRQATAREQRTKSDWAIEVAGLLDTHYADCDKITLISDNLNTHTKGAFYEAFEPAVARDYIKRIDFAYTPKHGSWLNIAECELSCMSSQCFADRRIGELSKLQSEIDAWATRTNEKLRIVDWQFKVDDSRIKLKRLYPNFKDG